MGLATLLGTTQTIGGLNNPANNFMVANSTTSNGTPSPTGSGPGTYWLVWQLYLWWGYVECLGGGGVLALNVNMGASGMQTLSGAQITYTGATTVNSGTLALQNTTGFDVNDHRQCGRNVKSQQYREWIRQPRQDYRSISGWA